MAEYNKPIPSIDPYVSKPFWDGAKEGKQKLPRCCSCNKCHWYPRIICLIAINHTSNCSQNHKNYTLKECNCY